MGTTSSTFTTTHRARWAALGAAVAVTLGAAGIGGYNLVSADVSDGDRPVFIPIAPCRLIDTRPGDINVGTKSSPLGPEELLTITAHGANGRCTDASSIPADATALAMNVTALGATQQTFLTFWGGGDNPGTANLNPAPGQPPTPNAVNTPLTDDGRFNVYNDAGNVNIVIDVNGYYAPHDHDDRYPAITDVYSRAAADFRFVQQPDRVVVGPANFVSDDPTGDKWRNDSSLFHADTSPDAECVAAPVVLPVDAAVESVELRYNSSSVQDVSVTLSYIDAVSGNFDLASFGTWVDDTVELPISPAGSGVTETFPADETFVQPGDAIRLEVCATKTIEIFGLTINLL